MRLTGMVDGCIYDPVNVKRVQYAYGKGHMVASHTWDHADLTTLTEAQINTEFSKNELAFERLLGVKPAFLRPPYGNYNNLVRQVAHQRGYKLVTWDFDSGDSTGSTAAQSNKAYDALVKQHPKTILALNHEVYSEFHAIYHTAYELMICNRNHCVYCCPARDQGSPKCRLQARHCC